MHLQITGGLFIVFANAYFILTSRWTSQHLSICETVFSPAHSWGPLCTMLRKIIILFLLTSLISCSDDSINVKFGTDPKCSSDNWLTFDYDDVTYYRDTSGTLFKNLSKDSMIELYSHNHSGKKLSEENINYLNDILSCKLWCESMDSIIVSLYNPQDLVVFSKDKKMVAYTYVCFSSQQLICKPEAKSKEFCALNVFYQTLH